MPERPLILLDVDGVLNPWRKPGPGWQAHKCVCDGRTFDVLLNPQHGPALVKLAEETGAELVWATTWEHDANRSIGPLIGLPELPVIEVSKGELEPVGCCSKSPAVAAHVNSRPFVWFDDDLNGEDSRFFSEHDGVGEYRLIEVSPIHGLTDTHLQTAARWLAGRPH